MIGRRALLAGLASLSGSSLALAGVAPPPGQALPIRRAVDIAFGAIKERLPGWREGCEIRVRPSVEGWNVYFEPVPMGPGLDVMVTVRSDGSTEVAPGY